ncbi:MAG: hypothetical protein KJZ83_17560 [Burkholderiaceae bacterium]|nr:hypothetical protein [Burkholderiaceae bacterium]
MNALVPPHGRAELEPLLVPTGELERERKRAATLGRARVSSRERGDIAMPGVGRFALLDYHGPD